MNILASFLTLVVAVYCCWYCFRNLNDWRKHLDRLLQRGYTLRVFRHKSKWSEETTYVAELSSENDNFGPVYDDDMNGAVWKVMRLVPKEENE